MYKVLLVDDDKALRELLSEYLTANGVDIHEAENGEVALACLSQQHFDLMVLDIMMPVMDGLTLLKSLKDSTPIATIMLTAKGDDIDRIIGLELGADDYLSKPCNPRELLARIHAVMRRVGKNTDEDTANADELKHGGLFINRRERSCFYEGQRIELTAAEFDLLCCLFAKRGQPIDKEQLAEQVLGRTLGLFDRSIDVHVSRLRKKLSAFELDVIKTIRGKGYQLTI